jgi:hypothetical protein
LKPAGCGYAGASLSGGRIDWGRDLVRAARTAGDDLRRKRQQLLSSLLRHSRIYSGGGYCTLAHRRWLAARSSNAAQHIVFQEDRRE